MWNFLILLLLQFYTYEALILPNVTEINGESYFYYFGYGSNLLAARIHVQNPSALHIAAGKLKNYRLDFNTYTSRWLGAPATIVPTDNATVYGNLWLIAMHNLDDIDNQEGVHHGFYVPITVPVQLLANSTIIMARAYTLVSQPTTILNLYEYHEVPVERQPSKTYLQCLVKGAYETGLPTDYIEWLKSLHHNNQVVPELENLLQLADVELLHSNSHLT